jgi:hypothetical protein
VPAELAGPRKSILLRGGYETAPVPGKVIIKHREDETT